MIQYPWFFSTHRLVIVYNWPKVGWFDVIWLDLNLYLAKTGVFCIFVAKYNTIMVGRVLEKQLLQRAIDRQQAQIVIVYGRRRVGKTFLVNEFFNNDFAFKHTALSPFDRKSPETNYPNNWLSSIIPWNHTGWTIHRLQAVGVKRFTCCRIFLTARLTARIRSSLSMNSRGWILRNPVLSVLLSTFATTGVLPGNT